jgi:hypothetical protein
LRADDGDDRSVEHRRIAHHGQQRRRHLEVAQSLRVVRFTVRDEARAVAFGPFDLALGVGLREQDDRTRLRRLAGERGQGVDCAKGRAVSLDQCPERCRPDGAGADQAQARTPFFIGQNVRRAVHLTLIKAQSASSCHPSRPPLGRIAGWIPETRCSSRPLSSP